MDKYSNELNDEQIIGMIRRTTNEIKPNLIKLLSLFDYWAKINNLEYCLSYGSLLGAIRDNGFIPYDDDLDIMVDTDKFIKLISKSNVININNEKIYISAYIPYAHYKFKHESLGQLDLDTLSNISILDKIPSNLFTTPIITSYRNNNIYTKTKFNIKLINFEGIYVPIPVNYDTILKLQYGEDYMTVYYVTNHQYTGYFDHLSQSFKKSLRKLTRKEVYDLVDKSM